VEAWLTAQLCSFNLLHCQHLPCGHSGVGGRWWRHDDAQVQRHCHPHPSAQLNTNKWVSDQRWRREKVKFSFDIVSWIRSYCHPNPASQFNAQMSDIKAKGRTKRPNQVA
jgi:hypothetical protein